jgi:hypothetical protein
VHRLQTVDEKMKLKEQVAPTMSTMLYVITGCGMGYMTSTEHPKALGDIMESAIGAVFLDTGMDVNKTYPVRRSPRALLQLVLGCSCRFEYQAIHQILRTCFGWRMPRVCAGRVFGISAPLIPSEAESSEGLGFQA